MVLSVSKRVSESLSNSTEFNSACNSTYEACLSLAQHTFDGLKPYHLFWATERLHHTLCTDISFPLISKWVSSPSSHRQVDKAFKLVMLRRSNNLIQESETDVVIRITEFRELAVEVFTYAVVYGVRGDLLKIVLFGLAGIAGIRMIFGPSKTLFNSAIGVYTIGLQLCLLQFFG